VVVEQYEYDPYGKASVYVGSSTTAVAESSVGLPFLWKGVRLDSETGLLQMRNRYYSAALGRFLTRDPLGVWGDMMGQGNGYVYVGNCPLMFGDPLGLQSAKEPGDIKPYGNDFRVDMHFRDSGGYFEILTETLEGEDTILTVTRVVTRSRPTLVFEFSCESMRFGWFWVTNVIEEEVTARRFTYQYILETYKRMRASLSKASFLTDEFIYPSSALALYGAATVGHELASGFKVTDLTSSGRSMSTAGSGLMGAVGRWAGVIGVPVAVATVGESLGLKWAESKWMEVIEQVEKVTRNYYRKDSAVYELHWGCDLSWLF
jgi:RHS repeat-associated protein